MPIIKNISQCLKLKSLKRNQQFSKKTKKGGAASGAAGGSHFDIPAGTNNITFEMWSNVGVGI